MRIKEEKTYQITVTDLSGNFIGSRVDSYFRNLSDILYAAKTISEREHRYAKGVRVYCLDDDETEYYKISGERLIKE